MYYLNLMEENTADNSKRELRPKLFKRLRTFEWINPVHETVRLDPVIYNSDIEIMHLAKGSHAKRDFATFQKALRKGMRLDKTLHSMYAKELFIAGGKDDLAEAVPFFEQSLADTSSPMMSAGRHGAYLRARIASPAILRGFSGFACVM